MEEDVVKNSRTLTGTGVDRHAEALERRLSALPLAYKVLVANSLVVLFGAVAGTYVTSRLLQQSFEPSGIWAMLLFGCIGVLLSLAINYSLLRAAFEPLNDLEDVADRVQRGDLTARIDSWRFVDPQLLRISQSFNQTLDALEADRERLRRLADRVVQAQEEERKRIARDLHDDTAQVLFAQLLRVSALRSRLDGNMEEIASQCEEALGDAIEGIRRQAHQLRPPALDDLGLRLATEELCNRMADVMGHPVDLDASGLRTRQDSEVELVLYRVIQEALTNVHKHANANRTRVELANVDDMIQVVIADDGQGFDMARLEGDSAKGMALGLFGMEERVELVGGTMYVSSAPGRGTRITIRVPANRRYRDGSALDSMQADMSEVRP